LLSLQRLVALAGPLVELLFEIGRRGTAGAPGGSLLAAVRTGCLSAARFHCDADLASAINGIDVTSGLRLMRPSHDGSRHGTEIYHVPRPLRAIWIGAEGEPLKLDG
jgi:hypothetical protein